MADPSADSLGGDEYLEDYVAGGSSDGEEGVPEIVADIEDDGEDDAETGIPLSKKRKADDEDVELDLTAEERKRSKKEKMKEKLAEKKKTKPKNDYSVNGAALLEEAGISMKDCSAFEGATTDARFAEFIRDFLFASRAKALFSAKSKHEPGSPKVIVLSGSAIRAVDVARLMHAVGERKVAKLFAKHMKVKEQAESLAKESFPLAVGTPNRVLKLIQDGALKLDALEFVVADATYKDKKQRSLFDIQDVTPDLLKLLKTIQEKNSLTKICIF
ncbi:hypothetical protein HKX48_000416 [Thoreauomyces humboldtii]|nr:hypothetical protein HKX48_000416 [Thoreauomyces humboldtii]